MPGTQCTAKVVVNPAATSAAPAAAAHHWLPVLANSQKKRTATRKHASVMIGVDHWTYISISCNSPNISAVSRAMFAEVCRLIRK